MKSTKAENLKKGHDFEDFVGRLLTGETYGLYTNRPDRSTGGHIPLTTGDPDLVWCLRSQNKTPRFAIECKWRCGWRASRRFGPFVQIGDKNPLNRYRTYANENQIPTFLAIGIGGIPKRPESLYVIPLQKIPFSKKPGNSPRSDFLSQEFLSPFKCPSIHGKLNFCPHSELPLLVFTPIGPREEAATPPQKQRTSHVVGQKTQDHIPRTVFPSADKSPLPQFQELPQRDTARPPTLPRIQKTVISDNQDFQKKKKTSRGRITAALGIFSAICLFGILGNRMKDSPSTHPAPSPIPTKRLTERLALPPAPEPKSQEPAKPVANTRTAPPAKPLLRYQTPARTFLIAVEYRQPATDTQIATAQRLAKQALSLFAQEARPPYFAVPTSPSDNHPKLTAYMVYETASEGFCSSDVYLLGNRYQANTTAIIHKYPCLFLDEAWLHLKSD